MGELDAAGRFGGEEFRLVGIGTGPRAVGVVGWNTGGLSTSIGSGLGVGFATGLRPLNRGFSGVESLSLSITAALPMVGLITELRLRVGGRPGVLLAGGGGGGMNVCGLKVPAHSS